MIKDTISVEDALAFLNELINYDADALRDLIETRVDCNQKMADHPTIQVWARPGQPFQLGVLGLINGLFGADNEGWGPIAACFDVVCQVHGKVEGSGIVEDTCSVEGCGETLRLGPLVGFKRTMERDGNVIL
jgi:hypothetical protein